MPTDATSLVGASDHDYSDYDLVFAGVTIDQVTGFSDFKEEFVAKPNAGPGNKWFGMNTTAGANGCTFKIHIRQTSNLRKFVEDTARAQLPVPISWVLVRNTAKYPANKIIEEGAKQVWLNPASESFAEDAGDLTFDCMGIGVVKNYKTTPIGTA